VNTTNFFAELKRLHVYKVAVAGEAVAPNNHAGEKS
jgi:hypothetical protein